MALYACGVMLKLINSFGVLFPKRRKKCKKNKPDSVRLLKLDEKKNMCRTKERRQQNE